MSFKRIFYLAGIAALAGNSTISWSMGTLDTYIPDHQLTSMDTLIQRAQILNNKILSRPQAKVVFNEGTNPILDRPVRYLVPCNNNDALIYRTNKIQKFFGVDSISKELPLVANYSETASNTRAIEAQAPVGIINWPYIKQAAQQHVNAFTPEISSSLSHAWQLVKSRISPDLEDNQTWRIEPKKATGSFDHLPTFKECHPKAMQIWRNFRNDACLYGALLGMNRGLMRLKISNPPLPGLLIPAANAMGALKKTTSSVEASAAPLAWDTLQNSVAKAYSLIKPAQEALQNYPVIENAMTLWGHGSEIAKIVGTAAVLGRIASNCELINWSDQLYGAQNKILNAKSWLPKKTLLLGGFAASIYGMSRYNQMWLDQTLKFSANNKVLTSGITAIVSTLLPLSLQGINYLDNAIFGQTETSKNAIKDFSFGELPVLTKGSFTGKLPEKLETIVDMVKNPIRYEDIKAGNASDKSLLAHSFLLVGPPGTGKTMIAQQIGREIRAGYVFIDVTKLNTGTVGEGIKYLDRTFKHIQEMLDSGRKNYCVLFLDELDAAGKRHTVNEDDRGVTQENNRVVIKLLTLLNDLDPRIILIAATNKPKELDEALLRNGRISEEIHIGLPTKEERYELLAHYLRDVAKRKKVSMTITNRELKQIAEITENVSKGYFMVFAQNALMAAHKRGSTEIEILDLKTALENTKRDGVNPTTQRAQPTTQNNDRRHQRTQSLN